MTRKSGNFLTDLSLKTKTLFFIVLVTGAPVALLMWALLSSFTQASVDVEDKALAQTTTLIRQELLNGVGAKAKIYDITLKNLILDLDQVKDEAGDPVRLEKALGDFSVRNHIVSSAYVITPEQLSGASPAFPGSYAFIENGQPVYVGRWFGPYQDDRAPMEVVTYGLPLWQGDTLKGVLAFDLTVSSLLKDVIDIDPSQTSYVMIVRSDGTIVTGSEEFGTDFAIDPPGSANILQSRFAAGLDLQRIIAGRDETQGSFELPDASGVTHKIVTFANVPSFGARIFVVSPLDELLQVQREKAIDISNAIRRISFIGLFALLALGMLIAGAVYVFSENAVIRPLRRLMKGIVSLERAEFKVGTDVPVTSNDEIGALASRFNGMAARLRESYEGLEHKVEQRTAEIRKNLSEIERLNKFLIGRELRMRELKEELAKLKGEPPKKKE